MRRNRTDANHAAIAAALRKLGCYVLDMTPLETAGFDLLVAYGGRMVAMEVKDGSKPRSHRQLTRRETETRAALRERGVPYYVIQSEDEAVWCMGGELKRKGEAA